MPNSVYIFDTSPSEKRRSWGQLLGKAIEVQWDATSKDFRTASDIASDGVVVVHRSQFLLENSDLANAVKAVCDRHPKLIVVVVSGKSQDESSSEMAERYYFRKAPLATGWVDEQFADCFKRFIVALESDKSDFSLLEPTQLPCLLALAILCQGYLVARGQHHFLGLGTTQLPDMSSFPKHIEKTVTNAEWWQHPFSGINLEEAISNECGGVVPSEIRNLLDYPGGEDDTAIATAHSKIRQLLKQ